LEEMGWVEEGGGKKEGDVEMGKVGEDWIRQDKTG
jgi:hypothetical protein